MKALSMDPRVRTGSIQSWSFTEALVTIVLAFIHAWKNLYEEIHAKITCFAKSKWAY